MGNTVALGKLIRRLRTEQNMSQQQLADVMGVSRHTVMRWESGECVPALAVMSRLAEVLRVETYVLLDTMNEAESAPVIIIVEDESAILRGSVHVLEETLPNVEVFGFQDAQEALKFSENNRIAVAFLDIELPDQNGISLAQALTARNRRTNIVFLTGYPEYAMAAHIVHCSGFLLKPLTREKVRQEMEHLRFPVVWPQEDAEDE